MPSVLITGANRGLGLGFARAYLRSNWIVHAAVRNPSTFPDLGMPAEQLRLHQLDLEDFATIDALAAALDDTPLDLVISNAALTGGELGAFGNFDTERFLRACRINAAAPMRLLERLAPSLGRGRRPVFFAVSSRIGAVPFYGYAEYFASKSALNQLIKQASIALAPRGIIAVAAHPGWVETEATAGQGQAPLDVDGAAALLIDVISRLEPNDTGKFFDPDGSELPIVTQQHEVKFYSKPKTATR